MRFRASLLASAIGLLCIIAARARAQDSSLAADAKAFGARPAVSEVHLSPDGNSVIYLTPGPGRKIVAVVGDLNSGQFHTLAAADGDKESLEWCHFASSTRAVCKIGGLTEVPATGDLLGFSRLIALDLTGGNAKLLGQPETPHDLGIRQEDAEVVDWSGGSDGTVLMSRLYVPSEVLGSNIASRKSGWGVDRVNVSSLRAEPVEEPREAADYMSDGLGHVRIMSITDARNSGMLTGRLRYFYRDQSSRDWKPLFTIADAEHPEIEPLAIDASTDLLYELKKKDGRYALYSRKLDDSGTEALVAEDPHVDIDHVVRFGEGQRVIGYGNSDGERTYFDPEFKSLAASLARALPNSPIIGFADSSADANKLLIFAGSDSDPGRYYLFDRAHKTLTPAMVARPELQGRTLASVKEVTVRAPDGMSIPAFLTLPPGKDPKHLPAVVLPHGGPSARDVWRFDWLAQFLAARGYAVLQPEYRGSAGFGDAWLNENGFKNWRTSIGDITTSAKWLASQGIADPNRTAILGWSYGGYAALQSAVTEPSLYKAVIAIAPVTDLAAARDEARNFTNYDLVKKEIGEGPQLLEGSPLRRAASITAPVLLFHGTMDDNVRVSESQKMDAALRAAGKQSELIMFKGLTHQLDDSDARTQMLTKIGELLDRTIGR